MSFADVISGAAYALDTPGSLLRGVLAGKPGTRIAGRELLEQYGLLHPNRPGLDAGDVGGFMADVVLDPLNWVGGALAAKGLKYAGKAMAARKAATGNAMARTATERAAAPSLAEAVGVPPSVFKPMPKGLPAPKPSRLPAGVKMEQRLVDDPDPMVRSYYDVWKGDRPAGEVILWNDQRAAESARKMFGQVVKPEDKVTTLHGIGLYGEAGNALKSKGVGREMWRQAFKDADDGWLTNSQLGFPDDRSAVVSLEKLVDRGLVELHWKGGRGGAFVARATPQGKKWISGEITAGENPMKAFTRANLQELSPAEEAAIRAARPSNVEPAPVTADILEQIEASKHYKPRLISELSDPEQTGKLAKAAAATEAPGYLAEAVGSKAAAEAAPVVEAAAKTVPAPVATAATDAPGHLAEAIAPAPKTYAARVPKKPPEWRPYKLGMKSEAEARAYAATSLSRPATKEGEYSIVKVGPNEWGIWLRDRPEYFPAIKTASGKTIEFGDQMVGGKIRKPRRSSRNEPSLLELFAAQKEAEAVTNFGIGSEGLKKAIETTNKMRQARLRGLRVFPPETAQARATGAGRDMKLLPPTPEDIASAQAAQEALAEAAARTAEQQRNVERGAEWIAQHYFGKMNPEGQVINPVSGLPLFARTVQGKADLRKLLTGRIPVKPVPGGAFGAQYIPTNLRRTFVNTATGKRSVVPGTERSIEWNQRVINPETAETATSYGVHEGAHAVTDAQLNMHPQLIEHLTKESAGGNFPKISTRSGVYSDPYLADPTEIMARIGEARRAATQWRPELFDQMLNDPKTARQLSQGTAELVETYGPQKVREWLRMLPLIPAAGAVGYGITRNDRA